MEADKIDGVFLKSNVIDEETAKRQIKGTLKEIADSTCKSLGPYGSTTIIQDRQGNHSITKDGYTILKSINYFYDIPKTILEMVKKISRTLVRTVGDGSTSSIKIAYELFKSIEDISDKYQVAPQDIINTLNEIGNVLEKYIREEAIPITDDNFEDVIKRIASISTNNDETAGSLICEIFKKVGRYSFINLENGKTPEDAFELVDGVEVNRGYINQIMANQEDRLSFEYEDAYVFMCNDILDDSDMEWIADLIGSCCLKEDNPLVIVASSYSTSFRSFFYSNMQKNRNLPLVAIDIDCSTKKGKERFEDLALVLGCKYYDKYNGNDKIEDITSDDLGVCKRVVGNDLHCKFIGGYGFNQQQDKIQERIQELEEEYNVVCKQDENSLEEKDYDLFLIKKRIAMLQCSMATLYVGGKTELERETRKFLLEDAVYACRSTIDNGYIVGGNLIVPKVIYKHENAIVSDLLESDSLSYLKSYSFDNDGFFHFVLSELDKAFKQSFIQVLTNAHISVEEAKDIIDNCIKHDEIFNVKTREYESDTETKVINSVDTDIEIIKASFSIIGLLATSNQFITSNIVSPNNQ